MRLFPQILRRAHKAILTTSDLPGRVQRRVAKQSSALVVEACVRLRRWANHRISVMNNHCSQHMDPFFFIQDVSILVKYVYQASV